MIKKTAGYLYTSRVFLHAALHVVLIIFSTEYLHCDSQLNKKKTILEIYIKGRGIGRGEGGMLPPSLSLLLLLIFFPTF